MTDRLDTITLNTLEKGATVLLSLKKGSLSKKLGGDIQIGFSSISGIQHGLPNKHLIPWAYYAIPHIRLLVNSPQNITATTNGGMP